MSTQTSRDNFDRQQRQSLYDQARETYQYWQKVSRRATNIGLALSMLWIIAWGIAAILGFSAISLNDAIPPAIINAIANLPTIPTRAAKKQVEAIRKEMNDRSQFEFSVQTASKISDPKIRDEALSTLVCLATRDRQNSKRSK